MAAKTYAIAGHLLSLPLAWGRRVLLANPPLYARIECWGAAGERLALEYLRPDSVYPWDSPADGGPRPNTYDRVADEARVYRLAHQFAWDRDLLAGGQQVFAEVDDQRPAGMRIFAPVQPLPQTADAVPDVVAWLSQHPAIAGAIRWDNGTGGPLALFSAWTPQQKLQLASAFADAWNAVPGPLADPPPTVAPDPYGIVISAADAWSLYLQHVAHSLALEIRQAVPWSLTQLGPDDQLRVLSVREMFGGVAGGYRTASFTMPASPSFAYAFLRRNGLVGSTVLDTIARVLGWCRRNLLHFLGSPNWSQDHWQYDGIPVRRVLEGTVATVAPELGVQHWTAGCGGTSDFLKCLLRAVNIPVERTVADGHVTPWFTSVGRWLSHGDDPYDRLGLATPQPPASELLIDQVAFDGWFGPAVPAIEQERNVGRRVAELGLLYLPDEILHAHWQDRAAGRAPAASRVYNNWLKPLYPDINAILPLWPALDDKLRNFDGLGLVVIRLPVPLWAVRFVPPWVPVMLQGIPLLGMQVLTSARKR
jgi:hypothetical protein